jgi:hypothetical protein
MQSGAIEVGILFMEHTRRFDFSMIELVVSVYAISDLFAHRRRP